MREQGSIVLNGLDIKLIVQVLGFHKNARVHLPSIKISTRILGLVRFFEDFLN